MLSSRTTIVLVVIVALEVTLIVMGNVFTIFVFWTQRLRFKRTFLLLINLAVADLFVGLGEALVLAISSGNVEQKIENPWWAFQVLGSFTSVLYLALISLERVYSVLWPFRHRVASARAYVFSIVLVWVTGVCMSGMWFVRIYHNGQLYSSAIFSSIFFISLLIISASYLKIRTRLRSRAPDHDLDVRKQASREKTLRMSRTFFVVIAVSLVFGLPAFVMFLIKEFCSCFSPTKVWLVVVLQSVNSMVNPFVYSFRMPSFQDALKKCWKKRRQNIEIRDIPKKSHNIESKL